MKGQKQAGEQVLVYSYGGQLSLKEYLKSEPGNTRYDGMSEEEKEQTVVDISIGEELPEAGKEYVFFLIPAPDDSPLPSGVYEKVTVGPGTNLKISEDGLSASRIHPDTGLTEAVSLEEMKNMLSK